MDKIINDMFVMVKHNVCVLQNNGGINFMFMDNQHNKTTKKSAKQAAFIRMLSVLDDLEISYSKFQGRLGILSQHWANWGNRGLPDREIFRISNQLGLNADWLATGTGQKYKATGNLASTMEGVGGAMQGHIDNELVTVGRKMPLLSWVMAGDFCEASDQFTLADAKEWLPNPTDGSGPRTFALTVRGDSMDASDGYKEGEIVYIDPDLTPNIGNDVLASTDTGNTLKRYKEDELGPYLLALNGNKIIRPQPPWHICGVVVFSGRKRR
jgi:SOS-response transcriptional repressor LexA